MGWVAAAQAAGQAAGRGRAAGLRSVQVTCNNVKLHMLEELEYKDIQFGWEVVNWVAVNQICICT